MENPSFIQKERKRVGRPFQKGHTPHNKLKKESSLKEKIKEEIEEKNEFLGVAGITGKEIKLTTEDQIKVEPFLKANMSNLETNSESKSIDEDKNALELIESLEFKNGENTLTIRFSKKHNRMFRVQIFLNDQTEIRPVTYTGASTGFSFWNLLKGAMKK